MTVLSYQSIKKLCIQKQLVSPFSERTKFRGVTYGLSAAGYDVRIEFDEKGEVEERTLWPGQFILASTIERFKMPNNLVGIVHDKSSWARLGIAVQNTVIEPGWEGWLTLEITNHHTSPIFLKRGLGIAQIIFHKLDKPTRFPYKGKYQNQRRGPIDFKSDSL